MSALGCFANAGVKHIWLTAPLDQSWPRALQLASDSAQTHTGSHLPARQIKVQDCPEHNVLRAHALCPQQVMRHAALDFDLACRVILPAAAAVACIGFLCCQLTAAPFAAGGNRAMACLEHIRGAPLDCSVPCSMLCQLQHYAVLQARGTSEHLNAEPAPAQMQMHSVNEGRLQDKLQCSSEMPMTC